MVAGVATSVAVRPVTTCPFTGDCADGALTVGADVGAGVGTGVGVGVGVGVAGDFELQPYVVAIMVAAIAVAPIVAITVFRSIRSLLKRNVTTRALSREQRAAERRRPRPAADPDIAVHGAGKRSVFLAV